MLLLSHMRASSPSQIPQWTVPELPSDIEKEEQEGEEEEEDYFWKS